MIRVALISLIFLNAIGCESTPPETEICIASPIQGERLRIMVAYFDEGTIVETTHDRPFTAPTCLTLTRPTVADRPLTQWQIELDLQGRIKHPVWPLDVAIYDDINDNRRLDEGELRGNLSGERAQLPAWLVDYEETAMKWASIDQADDISTGLREFVWASVALDRSGFAGHGAAFERLPETVEIFANSTWCDEAFYPTCFPDQRLRPKGAIIVLDVANLGLRLTAQLRRRFNSLERSIWPIFEIAALPVFCDTYDDYLTATYELVSRTTDRGGCQCLRHEQQVYVYTGLERSPDWLDCSTAPSQNDTFIIGLTSTAQSSE